MCKLTKLFAKQIFKLCSVKHILLFMQKILDSCLMADINLTILHFVDIANVEIAVRIAVLL
jgi:hypothetical protein